MRLFNLIIDHRFRQDELRAENSGTRGDSRVYQMMFLSHFDARAVNIEITERKKIC